MELGSQSCLTFSVKLEMIRECSGAIQTSSKSGGCGTSEENFLDLESSKSWTSDCEEQFLVPSVPELYQTWSLCWTCLLLVIKLASAGPDLNISCVRIWVWTLQGLGWGSSLSSWVGEFPSLHPHRDTYGPSEPEFGRKQSRCSWISPYRTLRVNTCEAVPERSPEVLLTVTTQQTPSTFCKTVCAFTSLCYGMNMRYSVQKTVLYGFY